MKGISYLLTTAFLVVLPWFWIPKGFVYTSEESNFINYDIKIERASTMWTQDYGFGFVGEPSNQALLIPNAVFYYAARAIGFNSSDTQKLFLSFIFLSISLAFYAFSSLFIKSGFIKSIGLLVYLFNFYLIAAIGYTGKTLQLVLMPAIFYVTYKYLKTTKPKYLLQNYLWWFVFQGVFTNLPLAVTSLLVYFVALFYYLFSHRNISIKKTSKDLLIVLLTLLPILLYQLVIYWYVLVNVTEEPARYAFTAIGVPLSLILQLRGAWWEAAGHMGIHYCNLWDFYSRPLTVIPVSIVAAIILFCSVRITWAKAVKHKIKSTFWLCIYLLSVGFAAGLYFFPGLFQWMVNKVPLMVMFREPWAKFAPLVVFSFSAIVMMALDFFREKDHRKYLALSLVLAAYLVVQGYPFISGKVIDSEAIGWKRRLIKIPDYWEEYSRWTKENQKVILALPFGTHPFNSIYKWYEDDIGNTIFPMPCILGKTSVICNNYVDKYTSILRGSVDKKNFDALKLGGINLVLTQDDLSVIAEQEQFDWQEKGIQDFISPVPIATFGGKIRLYQLKNEYSRSKIYASQDVLVVNKNTKINNLPIKDLGRNEVLIYADPSIPTIDKTVTPDVSFNRISQTKYHAKVIDASEPFILVFNEAYHRDWKISPQGKNPEPQHFVVNGFANGWYIDPKLFCDKTPCEVNLDIEFVLQRYFLIGLYGNIGLSVITAALLLIILAKKTFRTKK